MKTKERIMRKVSKEEITHIKNSLTYGTKKVLCKDFLFLSQPVLSSYLRPKPFYNREKKKFELEYVIPENHYNIILKYIQTLPNE